MCDEAYSAHQENGYAGISSGMVRRDPFVKFSIFDTDRGCLFAKELEGIENLEIDSHRL